MNCKRLLLARLDPVFELPRQASSPSLYRAGTILEPLKERRVKGKVPTLDHYYVNIWFSKPFVFEL